MKSEKTCCFFGHRRITITEQLRHKLYEIIEELILDNTVTFLIGSKSDFNTLCWDILAVLKEKYPDIKRIYVRAEYPYIDDNYKASLLKHCEDTYFPKRALNSGRAVYIQRNYEMIEKSDICIVYFKNGYLPPKRRNGKQDLLDYQPKSGTAVAYNYALKNKKHIVNIAEYEL